MVISELRTTPGPTHSVFDLLAALIAARVRARLPGRIGVLGFAGGGMMAPLRGLDVSTPLETCDLDRASYELFQRHCPDWIRQVRWQQADALVWLRRQRAQFGLLMDDLSIPCDGDVSKPAVSWGELPGLMRDRLRPKDGWAVFNLMPPPGGRWQPELRRLAGLFPESRVLQLDEFENRILVAGTKLPSARELGRELRALLSSLRSRQATRFQPRSGS